jgi:hypothetical protein
MIDREHAIALLIARMYEPEPRPAPAFWLGALETWWAWEGRADARVMVSARRFRRRMSGPKSEPRPADVPLFIDSGAFSEIAAHGRWTWPAHDFAAFIEDLARRVGDAVEHVGIQDWMCEPHMLGLTGLDVEEHQRRTVASFLELRQLAPGVPWVPTLQGFTAAEYLRCAEMYAAAGVALEDQILVGLGSVCRRSNTVEIESVIDAVPARVRLHGYGVKSKGTLRACYKLASFDSMAWSKEARELEIDLRQALGLPADAPADQVMAATEEQLARIDLDLVDFFEWKRDACPRTAAASQLYAEHWRARQIAALAATMVDRLIAPDVPIAEPVGPEQLDMFLEAA